MDSKNLIKKHCKLG